MSDLNLGAGRQRIDGFMSVDMHDADAVHDLTVHPWPFADRSADQINASHILEHFDKAGGQAALRECWRILRPGGRLTVAVPDLDIFADCLNAGDWSRVGEYPWRDLNLFMGGPEPDRPEWRHRYAYTRESLWAALLGAGFLSARVREFDHALDNPDYWMISLYMQADK